MPFTLSHPAVVLPLLRKPFVPAALVAGAVAPDAPYFLSALGVASRSAQDWYEPFLNPTQTHSPVSGLLVSLPFALALVAVCRILRAPVAALLPPGLRLPGPAPTTGLPARLRHLVWLLVSAVTGIASHVAWDSFTHVDGLLVTHVELLRAPAVGGLAVSRLLQHVSTVLGLAAIALYLWRRRSRLRSRTGADTGTAARLAPRMRWGAVILLVAAPLLGGLANSVDDFHAYRYEVEADYSRPITVDLGNGEIETSYPTETVPAPWGTLAEGMLTGAARRAGASLAVALLLYSAAWYIGAAVRRPAEAPCDDARGAESRRRRQGAGR